MALKDDVEKLEDRVRSLETTAKVALALAVAFGFGGAVLGTQLRSAITDTSTLRENLRLLKEDIPRQLTTPVQNAKVEIKKYADQERDALRARQVVAAYALATSQRVVYGEDITINFDNPVVQNRSVTPGKDWRFHVPISGVYRITVNVDATDSSELGLTVKSRNGGPLLKQNRTGSAVGVDGIVELTAQDEIWVDIAHSSNPTSTKHGQCLITLLSAAP